MELTCSEDHFPASLSHCTFDEDKYDEQWTKKVAEHLTNLGRNIEFPHETIECSHIPSPPRNFRARTRFSVQFYPESNEIDYFCVDRGRKVIIKYYPIVAVQICQTMPLVIQHLKEDQCLDLQRGLSVVSFLSSSIGELLIGLVYDQSRNIDQDELWLTQATSLRECLLLDHIESILPDGISIMGRSRKASQVVGRNFVNERLEMSDGRTLLYKQPEGAFSNPNTQVSRMALNWLSGIFRRISTESGTPKNLLEMYCGNGNHTVALSPFCNRVVAVELSEALCKAARENLTLNCITNASVVHTHAAKFSHRFLKARKWIDPTGEIVEFDMVLVDPPRAGLDETTLTLILHYHYIVYISCCPVNLARDVRFLQEKGGFSVHDCATFDQFAYSSHLEIGMVLKKMNPSPSPR